MAQGTAETTGTGVCRCRRGERRRARPPIRTARISREVEPLDVEGSRDSWRRVLQPVHDLCQPMGRTRQERLCLCAQQVRVRAVGGTHQRNHQLLLQCLRRRQKTHILLSEHIKPSP